MTQQQIELQCQSCGMPLASSEIRGTDSKGAAVQDYCIYCYANGEFTQPDFTVDDMVGYCVPFLIEQGMEEQTARGLLAGSLPDLKRWSTHETEVASFHLVEVDELIIAGIATTTSNKQEWSAEAKIGGLWERFWKEGVQQSIPNVAESSKQSVYGCYIDYENGSDGNYKLLIGCKVSEIGSLPDGLEAKVLPASRYAVFTTKRGPATQVVVEAWQQIWKWADTSPLQRTFTGDFELYDERSADPDNAQIDIYIAIK